MARTPRTLTIAPVRRLLSTASSYDATPSRLIPQGGALACPAARATFSAWHDAVDTVLAGGATDESMAKLRPHVNPACVFHPPTYYKAWTGRDETLLLLGTVAEVFGPSFEYGRQWLSDDGREWALEFTADVGGGASKKPMRLTGIDLISLDEQGRISEFTVLARPPNAVEALKGEMMRRVPVRLAALKAKQMMGLVG